MTRDISESRLANLAAASIADAFDSFQQQFCRVTGRARGRFEGQDWHGMQADARRRLDLYAEAVTRVVADLRNVLADKSEERLVWALMKAVYSGLIAERRDWELAETFFNSVTRRVFTTVGVDPRVEFVATDFTTPPTGAAMDVFHRYERSDSTVRLVEAILTDFRFGVLYEDLRRDTDLVSRAVDDHLSRHGVEGAPVWVELVKQPFFRGKAAYLVGRLEVPGLVTPIVIALRNDGSGVTVDAVLMDEDDVSILFSFTRSYFHVEVDRPYDLVRFLSSIMPRKPIAELYRAIGHHKHGKTEQYRDLLAHLDAGDAPFVAAPGVPGLVMVVFTMEDYDFVFKVMRDVFGDPKRVTRDTVRDRYQLVFRHDRAGRLIDAQEFEHLQFDRDRFDPGLLEELAAECSRLVRVEGDRVVIEHAYIERRVRPLNLYVRQEASEAATAAVVDYGSALRDLAATNIFPGDMLLKNFGVTRHGRVVFYDYDELALLSDCRFRELPEASHPDDELSDEPWFGVDEHDLFPEEFRRFLGLPADLRQVFEEHHAELFGVPFWREIQDRLAAGEIIDIFPYRSGLRLQSRPVAV